MPRAQVNFQGRIVEDSDSLPEAAPVKESVLYYDYAQDSLMLSRSGGDYLPIVPGTPATPPVIGLVGDGITDNAFVIQEAIDALIPSGGGTETGISLDANRASQDIRFNVGTLNEQLRLAATGQLRLGSVSTNLGRLQVVGRADEIQAVIRANATQTTNAVEVQSSGGSLLFGIEGDGDIRTSRAVAATTPGSVVKKLEIFDAAGASLGFLPIYSAIT